MEKIKVVLIAAPGGTGKTELTKGLESPPYSYNKVKSYTTRRMRDGEHNYSDHIFVSNKEADRRLTPERIESGEIVAHAVMYGRRYWTEESQFSKDKINIYVIDPDAGREMMESRKGQCLILPIFLSAGDDVIRERLLSSRNPEEVQSKIDHDKEVFKDSRGFTRVDAEGDKETVLKEVSALIEYWNDMMKDGWIS